MTELENTQYILEYQVSEAHGYRIQFRILPLEEQLEGIVGLFELHVLRKEVTTDRFVLTGEKRVFVFPSQVIETIKSESLQLASASPLKTYGLLNDDQFSNWN